MGIAVLFRDKYRGRNFQYRPAVEYNDSKRWKHDQVAYVLDVGY